MDRDHHGSDGGAGRAWLSAYPTANPQPPYETRPAADYQVFHSTPAASPSTSSQLRFLHHAPEGDVAVIIRTADPFSVHMAPRVHLSWAPAAGPAAGHGAPAASTSYAAPGPAYAPEPANVEPAESHISSYYSLNHLPETHPLRRIRASAVRAQAAAMPLGIQPSPAFPHRFKNKEKLPFTFNAPPLVEYPLAPEARGGPWQPHHGGRAAGVGRIVTNVHDRSCPEVVYHDPTKKRHVAAGGGDGTRGKGKGKGKGKPFSVAPYRPQVEVPRGYWPSEEGVVVKEEEEDVFGGVE